MKITSAAQTIDAMVHCLDGSGYTEASFSEIRQVEGKGWSIAGVVDDTTSKGLTDQDGEVIHIGVR